MLITITLTLTILVAINFILLFFSCNKTVKKKSSIDKTSVVHQTRVSKKPVVNQLAPTGS